MHDALYTWGVARKIYLPRQVYLYLTVLLTALKEYLDIINERLKSAHCRD